MKKVMQWMWEYPIEETDEKGKIVKKTEWRLEPREDSKRVRVAYYRETEND